MTGKVKRGREHGATILLYLAEQIAIGKAMIKEDGFSEARPAIAVVWTKKPNETGTHTKQETRGYGSLTLTVFVENVRETNEAISEVATMTAATIAEQSLGQRLGTAERMYLEWFERYDTLHRSVNGTAPIDPLGRIAGRTMALTLARSILAEGGHSAKAKLLATNVVELLSESGK